MTKSRKIFWNPHGDALIIPLARLVQILESIRRHIKGVKRVGTYANAKSILKKTVDELTELKKLGLGIIYIFELKRETLNYLRKSIPIMQAP